MIAIISFVFLVYAICIVFLNLGYRRKKHETTTESNAANSFSILIPFRNEEKHLFKLCESLSKIKYSPHLFELIFIDDNSTDNSVDIIKAFNFPISFSVKLLHSVKKAAAPKKAALQIGISAARFPWIITTDADCICPELWLESINHFIINNSQSKMICGPLSVTSNEDEIQDLQQMENLSLQFVTRAALGWNKPIMANGANLIYSKEAFYECGGFEGNLDIASGDDIFLMEKFRKNFPNAIRYLSDKNAIVRTHPVTTWKEVINQRVRWASKTRKQKNNWAFLIGGLVTLTNFILVCCFFLIFIDKFPKQIFLVFLILKISLDFWMIRRSANFFNQKIGFIKFFLLNIMYTFLQIFIFFKALTGKYIWKDNQFKT